MVGVVIAAHGELAHELFRTARFILGEVERMVPLTIDPSQPVDQLQSLIKRAIREVDEGDGVLIITDMYGGTPANMALSFLEEGRVEIVTGANLPMLIRACQVRDQGVGLAELAETVVEYGRKSIRQASALLASA